MRHSLSCNHIVFDSLVVSLYCRICMISYMNAESVYNKVLDL